MKTVVCAKCKREFEIPFDLEKGQGVECPYCGVAMFVGHWKGLFWLVCDLKQKVRVLFKSRATWAFAVVGALFVLAALFYGFTWSVVKSGPDVIRIRRFTGRTERLVSGHWTRVLSSEEWEKAVAAQSLVAEKERMRRKAEEAERKKHEPVNRYLTDEQLEKITCSIRHEYGNHVAIQVYNGLESIPLSQVKVAIEIREMNVITRKYHLIDEPRQYLLYCQIAPLSSAELKCEIIKAPRMMTQIERDNTQFVAEIVSAAGWQRP